MHDMLCHNIPRLATNSKDTLGQHVSTLLQDDGIHFCKSSQYIHLFRIAEAYGGPVISHSTACPHNGKSFTSCFMRFIIFDYPIIK